MILDGYGFYFEKAGRSAAQGAIAPAEQFFEGSVAEMSVARELGQNSLDAARGDGPVLMQFELRQMETEDIPGIAGLVEHLESVVDATRGASGNERMRRALSLAQQDHLWVLRVGDYGTTGLIGNENDTNSPLAALTRGEGISANDGTRGGSFGIGSAVGPMASDLSTVMYTSMSDDRLGEVVFAAQSRLATHSDQEGVTRRAEGYFTLLSDGECFRYLRDPGPIGPFAPRVEPGTDIFLLGYRKANAAQLRGGCWGAERDGGLVGALVVAVVLGRELVSVAAFADPGIGAFASWGVEPGEEFIDRAGEVVSFRGGGKIPRGR